LKRHIDSLQRELTILTTDAFRKHPNVVRLLQYDLIEDGDDLFTPALIIERAHYGNLTNFLKRNSEALLEQDKVDICWDVSSGLC